MWNNRIETAPENDGEVFGYIYPGKATAGYGKYAMEYCASSGSWHLARFIVKKRDKEGNVINVLYVYDKLISKNSRRLNISKNY